MLCDLGDKLPSMAELRRLYGVSNIVVRDALLRLKGAGLVRVCPESGCSWWTGRQITLKLGDRGVDRRE